MYVIRIMCFRIIITFRIARRRIHTPELSTVVEFFRKIVFRITCVQIIISFRFARPYIHAPEFYAAV